MSRVTLCSGVAAGAVRPERSVSGRTGVGRVIAGAVVSALICLAAPAATEAQQSDSVWLASKGFHFRAADAVLHLSEGQISAARQRLLSGVLAVSPRMDLEHIGGGRMRVWLQPVDPDAGVRCAPDLYLNGRRVVRREGEREPGLDRLVAVRDVSGLEIFDGANAPVGLPNGCGAVLVWSRRLAARADDPFIGRIAGHVVQTPANTFMDNVQVRVEPGGHRVVTGRDGRFDFAALPPGRYRVEVEVPDAPPWASWVVVRSAAAVELGVEVEIEAPPVPAVRPR